MNTETVAERIQRLAHGASLSEKRQESLAMAHDAGVNDDTFERIATATIVNRSAGVILPPHRFEGLSRGRGWCRLGRGSNVHWGERVDGGYRVERPGRWIVGGNDGFSRKKEDAWNVEHVRVGNVTWTIAN